MWWVERETWDTNVAYFIMVRTQISRSAVGTSGKGGSVGAYIVRKRLQSATCFELAHVFAAMDVCGTCLSHVSAVCGEAHNLSQRKISH